MSELTLLPNEAKNLLGIEKEYAEPLINNIENRFFWYDMLKLKGLSKARGNALMNNWKFVLSR